MILSSIDVDKVVFFLQHKNSGNCIPKNPDRPYQPFDCLQYSGQIRLVADSISGLVDCTSIFAAPLGIDTEGRIYNADCIDDEMDPFRHDSNILLMTYTQTNGTNATPILVWGERSILERPDEVEQYNIEAEWNIVASGQSSV